MTLHRFQGFRPEAITFLENLRKHNNRPWFQAHKDIYENVVKAPLGELILRIGEAFRRFAPEMVADPRISLYRIYRDTRFSRDKSPYKTQVAAVFPVRGLPKNSGPGLYFHFSPDEVLIGGGIYMPEPHLLRAVRERIAARPRDFLAILEARSFRSTFGELEGERLVTMPKGFASDSAAAEYLRYKQFLFAREFPATIATTPRLESRILDCFEKGMLLIRFLQKPAFKSLAVSRAREISHLPDTLR